jgi:CHAT domain-containing protein
VARTLGVPSSEIKLGRDATETTIKALSSNGQLGNYRIIHFATHAALTGQVEGVAEPNLILTPPDNPTPDDDGYLSASEITELKLDADWVVLSACNTAAADHKKGEAMSGMARAFFYAGARALLVSHWNVYSNAAVKLTTHVYSELGKHPEIGRSEALRRSMLAMIDQSDLRDANPAYWAPFVVVGEGGAPLLVAAAGPVPFPTTTGTIPASATESNEKAATTTPPESSNSFKDKKASASGVSKKAKSKPTGNDWMTNLFGQ